MRVFLACLLVHATSGVLLQSIFKDVETVLSEFERFKKDYGKVYHSGEEESARFAIYLSNRRYIDQHNEEYRLGKHAFTLKMNQFGDIPHEDFVATMNGLRGSKRFHRTESSSTQTKSALNIPESVDWRKYGAVTPVKDQGKCGSCWAFSATGALEGQHFFKTGQLVSLSEQNLMDCSTDFGTNGCYGGSMDLAFEYVKANRGIDDDSYYPYEGKSGLCRYNPYYNGATNVGRVDLKSQDEVFLTWAISTHGPVSVGIDANHPSIKFYHSGVYSEKDCSPTDLNHGVLVVGYGTETDKHGSKQDYYIVKNSWNVTWGEQGYIKMARNMNNMCGIATWPALSIV